MLLARGLLRRDPGVPPRRVKSLEIAANRDVGTMTVTELERVAAADRDRYGAADS